MDKLGSQDPEFTKLPKAERLFLLNMASSLVALTTALAEAQDEILLAISANHCIVRLLTTLICTMDDPSDQASALRADSMACLMLLCEDNEGLAKRLLSSPDSSCFHSLMDLRTNINGHGVFACGVIHNIFASLAGTSASAIPGGAGDDSLLIPTLAKVLSSVGSEQRTADGDGLSLPEDCQELALEILASIGTELNSGEAKPSNGLPRGDGEGAGDDEDMGDVDGDVDENGPLAGEDETQSDNADEMDEDEMEADMDMVIGAGDQSDQDGIDDMPVLKSLLQMAIPQLIRIARIQVGDEAPMSVQRLALSALNNIAWSVSLLDFSDSTNEAIQRSWDPVGRRIWADVVVPIISSDTADLTLATQVTSLAWAVSRSLRGAPAAAQPLAADEHRKFMALYQSTRGATSATDTAGEAGRADPFHAIGVKCIGVLGQLALDPAPIDRNREIGTFLVTVLDGVTETTPAADAVEALDQIFDIYGDEALPCDKHVFWKESFLRHLEDAVPKARAMAKSVDRKRQAELRTRADEVVMNLTRFIAYKRKHRPQP